MGRRARPIESLLEHRRKHLTQAEIRQRKEAEEALRPPADDVRPPEWLSEAAKQEFLRVVQLMEQTGLLTNADVDELAVYADAVAKYAQATQELERDGLTIAGAQGGRIQHPAVLVATKYAQIIAKLAPRLGLDPSGRASLAIPKREKKADPFEERFGVPPRAGSA